MTDTADLAVWLRAQLDEDERLARAVGSAGPWRPDTERSKVLDAEGDEVAETFGGSLFGSEPAEHIAAHDPARVLRAVAAKRAILNDADDFAQEFATEEARTTDTRLAERCLSRASHWRQTLHQQMAAEDAEPARLPAGMAHMTINPPERCPCGHPLNDNYMCIEGHIYGPCESEYCGGICEEYGTCTADDCACKEGDEQTTTTEDADRHPQPPDNTPRNKAS